MTQAEQTIAHSMAGNILAFSERGLDAETLDHARAAILDTIGVTLAGSRHPAVELLLDAVSLSAAPGAARVFGRDITLNPLDAVLLNGMAGHVLDFDDANSHLHGHASVVVLPVILALADQRGADAATILRAYVTGYEACARMGDAVGRRQYTLGWHPTTSIGIFGAVAAASVMLELDVDATAMALAIAASHASGIKSNFGTPTKPLMVGQAARNALMAALLAERGFTGGKAAFEHPQGYFAVYNGAPENWTSAPLTEPWTDVPRIDDREKSIQFKRYPCCYALAAPIDGILDLRARESIDPSAIAHVSVAVHPIRFPHIDIPKPETPFAAKFSTTYCVARALVGGTIVLDDFEEASRFNDPLTRQIMERTELVRHEDSVTNRAFVTIRMTDDREFNVDVAQPLGATYANPLPAEVLREKFIACAGRVPGLDPVAYYTRLSSEIGGKA
ncbi:MmgE/PrpD family protein [Rhizobium puerariae]|uniref:MmgE/PrpD family protein n=1 Tax=Rhizobium puerariae TaxID=1585791 RepID=A0ABV6AKZ5_9HYPH